MRSTSDKVVHLGCLSSTCPRLSPCPQPMAWCGIAARHGQVPRGNCHGRRSSVTTVLRPRGRERRALDEVTMRIMTAARSMFNLGLSCMGARLWHETAARRPVSASEGKAAVHRPTKQGKSKIEWGKGFQARKRAAAHVDDGGGTCSSKPGAKAGFSECRRRTRGRWQHA
jgi:hypothetical protein